MYGNVCVCRSCVDPREHGFFVQHGLSPINNGFYMARNKGGFVPKPSTHHDISTTGLMLLQMNFIPTFVFQGHRDCAAVRTLFQTHGRKRNLLNDTEREFCRSYSGALDIVKSIAAELPIIEQLRILEKICVLQGINNLLEYKDLRQMHGYRPVMHAYYSLTHFASEGMTSHPEQCELMIYDPQQGVFVHASKGQSNDGIRMADLIDIFAFVPLSHDNFKIVEPIDLKTATRNEVRLVLEGDEPHAFMQSPPSVIHISYRD